MIPLALDVETSAELLNIDSKKLEEILQKREIEGIRIDNEWRVSIFVLAKILNTSPDEILDYLEDLYLAEKIEEVEGEPFYSPKEGKKHYEKMLPKSR
jgi:hypothetical protein